VEFASKIESIYESIQEVRFPKSPSEKAWLTTHAVTMERLELMTESDLGGEGKIS